MSSYRRIMKRTASSASITIKGSRIRRLEEIISRLNFDIDIGMNIYFDILKKGLAATLSIFLLIKSY